MSQSKKPDLLDLVIVFASYKILLLKVITIVTLVGIIIAFIWPKTYKSELTYIVNDGNSINLSSGGLLSGLANLSVANTEISADQILIVLRSKTIQDQVIKEFNLQEVYGNDVQEALRKNLDNNIQVEEFREGGIGLNSIIATKFSVKDKDPERAYNMINYYYSLIDSTVKVLNKSNVEDGYFMLESRLFQNEKDLETAEDSLLSFQSRYGILEIEEQSRVLIQNIAAVKAQSVKLEIEIGFIKEMYNENSSMLKELEAQKKEVDKKYAELLGSGKEVKEEFDIFRSISDIPELYIEFLRRYREVEVQQEIYKVLYPQYEQQKLNYEEISSGLMLIDNPNFPTYKDSPKRAYIMIASFLFGLFLAIIIVLFKEWRINIEENDNEIFLKYQKFISLLKLGNAKN